MRAELLREIEEEGLVEKYKQKQEEEEKQQQQQKQ